ncbi:MAG: hypothetical protein Pg6C_08270 [Treponemataceae bacterium]|nr:MAG: hypothetical protein Pg6C_08270 [Treponemataceae bacterium]
MGVADALLSGGDTGTLAYITDSVAEALYEEIPRPLAGFIDAKISGGMKQVITRFHTKYLQGFWLDYYVK